MAREYQLDWLWVFQNQNNKQYEVHRNIAVLENIVPLI